MPRQSRNRRSAEGKSRPLELPTQRGSRSKVNMAGRPYALKKAITARRRRFCMKIVLGRTLDADGVCANDNILYLDDTLVLALCKKVKRRQAGCASLWSH